MCYGRPTKFCLRQHNLWLRYVNWYAALDMKVSTCHGEEAGVISFQATLQEVNALKACFEY